MKGSMIATVLAATLSACAGGGSGEGTEALLEAPPDGQGWQLSLHASIAPGEEASYCHYVVLPEGGGAGLDVSAVEHRLSEGASEVRLYHTDLTLEDAWAQPTRFACDTGELPGNPSYRSSAADGAIDLPQGVALHFEPGEVVLLQARYENAGPDALDAEVRLNLWTATDPVSQRTRTLLPEPGQACEIARGDAGGC